MDGEECAGFRFYSNFDSANLRSVELRSSPASSPPSEVQFDLTLKSDCASTNFVRQNRSWFYFGIKGPGRSQLVKFNIVNLNKKKKLFSEGMVPVYKIIPEHPNWERIEHKPTFEPNDPGGNIYTLSFKFKVPSNNESLTYIAFTYPYSFSDLQCKLDAAEKRFVYNLWKDDIYYQRETVCYSLQNRPLDLVTISSYHNISSSEREVRLQNLFPKHDVLRPHKFPNKKYILISARVHPAETPSSFVLNGLMNLLMDRVNPVAVTLRRKYVFKFLPCLNPDGVVNGHVRTDSRGVDLNRVYLNPTFEDHPTIYAARSLIRYYHFGFEKTEIEDDKDQPSPVAYWCSKCNIKIFINENADDQAINKKNCKQCGQLIHILENAYTQGDCKVIKSGLYLYIDIHAHSNKKGIFMYGNHFNNMSDSVECMLLPKIMSINNYNFHFTTCNFTERNMYLTNKKNGLSREGSGRVAVFKLTGLVRSYTLECSYNTGKIVNVLPMMSTPRNELTMENTIRHQPPIYTPQIFEEVGKSIGFSILDLTADNPFTRLPNSSYRTLSGLKNSLRSLYLNEELFNKPTRPLLIPQRNKKRKGNSL